jgi:hypothetical protein
MGILYSFMRKLFRKNDWSAERNRFQKTRQDLLRSTTECRAAEYDIVSSMNQLKRQVNEMFFTSQARSKAHKKPMAYTDDEKRVLQQMMNDIYMYKNELLMKSKNVQLLQKQLNNISNYIMQQDTVHQLRKAMDVVKEVGLDFEGTDSVLEMAAHTSDKMDMLANNATDRMAAVLAENDQASNAEAILAGSCIPFADVAPHEYTSNTPTTVRSYQEIETDSLHELESQLREDCMEQVEDELKQTHTTEAKLLSNIHRDGL